jgi:2-polyprenyl-3-methyl-5-hydroxy-6-metoxy-1,4-benzoquinol methylase
MARKPAKKAPREKETPEAPRFPRLPVHRVDPFFFEAYRGTPPWDIGRAQPAFVELANAGQINGRVLDVGCGSGDLALELAEEGHEVWGVDIVPKAIERAKSKAKVRGVEATFLVGDAVELEHLGETFDTITDCGLFHTFNDDDRILYERSLKAVIRPGGVLQLMTLSDWEEDWGGPRRVSQQEIIETFSDGWRVDDIQEARFLSRFPMRGHAWLATIVRETGKAKPKRKRAQAEPPKARLTGPLVKAKATEATVPVM